MNAGIYQTRRYIATFNSRNLPQMFTDCLIIGSGVAGLRAAVEADRYGSVMLVTKQGTFESNTTYAQGGVAVVLKPDEEDNPDLHIADTLKVGCGLNDFEAVKTVIMQGPVRVRELIEWGAIFDSDAGELDLGREAGHSASRVIHAQGDATGKEIVRSLVAQLKKCPNVTFHENHFVIDLLTDDHRCLGALVYHDVIGLQIIWAKQTILATGGCGRIFQETTNPEIATGDGLAMAWRAGAVLQDMEMIQFHPTTLYIAGASRALISEAVRGEGAYLVDKDGYRFMPEYHSDAELAPRDVVSRSIIDQMLKTNSRYVFLDARHIPYEEFSKRFPYITQICESFDINVSQQLIPVRPSAHYMIGGVKVDLQARTNLAGLYACGEVACSGLHGANRLASNSLLEGLVFGKIAGQNAGEWITEHPNQTHPVAIVSPKFAQTNTQSLDIQDVRNSLRSIMWRHVGIRRQVQRMTETIDAIEFWGRYVLDKTFDRAFGWEAQNMLTTAGLMTRSALTREESRGVHYREDFPQTDNEHWRKHIMLCRTK
ncbi:MAG: L-aspartate oxidase [Phycisphaerae bacterium]